MSKCSGKLTSLVAQRQAETLLNKIKENSHLPDHTMTAIVADTLEMLMLMADEYGYETKDFSWKGINEKLYEWGVLKQTPYV